MPHYRPLTTALLLIVLVSAHGADRASLAPDSVISLNIPPISSSSDRARLWRTILEASPPTTINIKAGETPEMAIRAKCGSVPEDLATFFFDLNPEINKATTEHDRVSQFIPCPYWYFGNNDSNPTIPVKAGEKLDNLLPFFMGTNGPTTNAKVTSLNKGLVNSQGEIMQDGNLELPYLSRRLKLPTSKKFISSSAAKSITEPIVENLSKFTKNVVTTSGVIISPSEYHLVGADAPFLEDPVTICGGPVNNLSWPSDLQAIAATVSSLRKKLTHPPQGLILVADTGADLSNEVIKKNLWINRPVEAGFPSQTYFQNDLHGASMVTRRGDDINPTPGFYYKLHGTNALEVMTELSRRSPELNGSILFAIAKLNEDTSPYSIGLDSIPSAFIYARNIYADAISLSVVIGAPVAGLLDGLRAANFLVVTAAGNNGQWLERQKMFPPAFNELRDQLIVVGSHDWNGKITSFSNRGQLVDILAPGCAIPIQNPDGTITLVSGTSFSTPFISSTIGLLRSIGMPPSPVLLKTRVLASADFDQNLLGLTRYGLRLNMVRALHVRDDSISITTNGKTNALYGSIEAPQTWTCDVHGETHAFNSSQVYKIIPAYPAIGGPAVRIWEKPAIGGFIEVQCDGGFDQANLRFRPENSENTLDIPWSDVHDVVPRATQ